MSTTDSQDERFSVTEHSFGDIARRVRPLLRPETKGLAIASILVAVVGLSQAVGPLFGKYIIDVAIPAGSVKLAAAAGALFLFIQIVRMAIWYLSQRLVLVISENLIYRLRTIGFRHINRLCMRFHGRFSSGFIHDRIFERSICSIGGFLQVLLANAAAYLSGLVFSLMLCLWLSPGMTGVIVCGALLYVVVSRQLSPRIYRRSREAHDAHTDIHAFILDKLRGAKTIQAFALEERVERDFGERAVPVRAKWLNAQLEIRRLQFFTQGLSVFITSVVYIMGASLVIREGMKLGTMVAFIGYQAQFITFIAQLANMQGQFNMAKAGFDQFFTVIDTASSVKDNPDGPMPEHLDGHLEMRNVSFAYDAEHVLENFNLVVPRGQSIALVGRSGSGKSTIANLLLRFYDPNSGALLLDGQDVRKLPLRKYRSLFGVVLQEAFLFDDTIAANLRCGRPSATDEELLEALRQAQALEFVERFPAGLQHRVGEGGSQLSGGQRQRLAIARCILSQPRFLILDEATSALDGESERLVQKAFDALFQQRTAFIIAHRLSTIRRADRILVLEHGKIVEDGDFKTLLNAGGQFAYFHTIATSSSERSIKLEEAGFA